MVITTAHKGVFFGYTTETGNQKTIQLNRCRMCVYWTSELRGVMGLAATGPGKGCKIGPAVPSVILQDVTSTMEVTAEAAKKWEEGTWS